MNFPLFVARRYLFSRKSTHAINVISAISVIGVAVATMALVIVLSVFNGFHDLVASLFTNFDPQLEVVPTKGKTAASDDPTLTQIRQLPQVDVATESVEDQALAVYHDKQAMVTVKGVEDNFAELSHINEILYGDGEFSLHAANLQYGTPGLQLAYNLGLSAAWEGNLYIFAPKREGQLDMANPTQGFVVDSLITSGVVFNVKQAKYDRDYILTSISFTRKRPRRGESGNAIHCGGQVPRDGSLRAARRHLPHHVHREADGLHLPHLHLGGGLLQHRRLPLHAHHRQERRRGNAPQPGSQRPPDSARVPLR